MTRKISATAFISVVLLVGACTPESPGPWTAQTSPNQVALTNAPAYPLKLAAEGARYLIDQNGQPFFWSGDSPWSLIAQPSLEDATLYLDDRMAKGFNVLMVNLIEHKFATNAPANYYKDVPFTGRVFVTPNEAYFAHADAVIQAAATRGMTVLLAPIYLGYGCGAEGWCADVQAATLEEMQSWGQYVGTRYRGYDNIVWLIGGDANPTLVQDKVQAFVDGLLSVDTRHLLTVHDDPETFAVDRWPNASWLTINSLYTYSTVLYQGSLQAYQRTPVMPFFLLEANYENEHGTTPQTLRAQAYWPVLMGGMGEMFGNCPMWGMGGDLSTFCGSSDWKTNLGSAGSRSMQYLKQLFVSRPWYSLVPDQSHAAVTDGYGGWGSTTYVVAALASDGATLIAYLPAAQQLTVDLRKISGAHAQAWWLNPGTGTVTSAGVYATSGTQNFTPPSGGDWVMVVDDASRGYPAPGTQPQGTPPTVVAQAAVTPSTVTETSAALTVLGGDDGGERGLVYRWDATSAPAGGSVTFSANGSNAAKSTTATFSAAGSYVLRATITDGDGQAVTSTVAVTVAATFRTFAISPSTLTLAPSGTQQFTATAKDQFGNGISPQAVTTWSASGGNISSSGFFTAQSTAGGPYTVTASSNGISATASVTISAPEPADVVVNFEDLSDSAKLGTYGGITWGTSNGGWKVWASPTYTKNAYLNSSSRTQVTGTLSLPVGTVLKSVKIAVGSGGSGSVTISSVGNADRTYSIKGTYQTAALAWTTAASTITIAITCSTSDGASDLAFDNITYGPPSDSSNQAPTVATAASASPSPVTTTATTLSVLGADDGGESSLTYTWAATTVPSGGSVSFSANGSNAAKSSTATFTKAGSHKLTATLRDAAGLTVSSSVTVVVQQMLAAIAVSPSTATVNTGATQQFAASASDQFGNALTSQPTFTWTTTGGGTISATGLFTACSTAGGPYTVNASTAGLSAAASVTINAQPTANVVVNFEDLAGGTTLSSYGGITWGTSNGGWRVCADPTYTKNAYLNNLSKKQVTGTFSLPAGTALKSLKIAVGSSGSGSVKLRSPGNPDQTYSVSGTYQTKVLGWTVAASTVTVSITCARTECASDLAFDDIVYGAP